MRRIVVAAAALIDGDDRVLVARRPAGKSFAGQWEFPGGKLEPGETAEAALVRELEEEIGIVARALTPLTIVEHSYPGLDLVMHVFTCRAWKGTPAPREGQALAWADLAGLARLTMPPADVPIIAALAGILPSAAPPA